MNVTPEISLFRESRVKCACGSEIPILEDKKLHNVKCSYCLRDVLVPAKISGFWLFAHLGEGGMGKVFRAVSENTPGEFAVKVLPRGKMDDISVVKDFLREMDAARQLGSHKNIVKVLECGFSNGEYYIATEILGGERLDRKVERQFHLTEREAFGVMGQILDAEIHMVSKGFLYRDLKPQNIIVERNGNIKIFDFGLAMRIDDMAHANSDSDFIEGSPFYMPPERIVGAPEAEYSEIYSMGMLFFYLLAGRPYYTQKEIEEIVRKHIRSARTVSCSAYVKHCRAQTIRLLDEMIQRDPKMRPHCLFAFENSMRKVRNSIFDIQEPECRPLAAIGKTVRIVLGVERRSRNRKRKGGLSRDCILRRAAVFILAVIVLGSSFSIAGIFYNYSNIKKKTRTMVADVLGISADIGAPDKSRDEIENMISRREKEISDEKISSLAKFDPEPYAREICAKLGINPLAKRIPAQKLEKLDEFVSLQEDAYMRRNGSRDGFDGAKYYRDSGYILVGGKWLSETEAVNAELHRMEDAFSMKREAEICEIRKSARSQAENEIYRIQGYISYMGKWTPARKLLDELVAMKMKDAKSESARFGF